MYNNAQRYIFMPEYPPLMLVEPIANVENKNLTERLSQSYIFIKSNMIR